MTRLDQAIAGKHVPVLDGIRGFAVAYVILYHFMPRTLSLQYHSGLLEAWDTFWLMGWSGVDLFFVLSGFLITGILYKTQARPDYFRHFYIRRFLRIFPLYYLVLLVCLVVVPLVTRGPVPEGAVWYWLYLSNFDTELGIPMHAVLVVAWSLAIEEQYYLVYPALVWRLSYRHWVRLLIGLIVLSIGLRVVGHVGGFFQPRQMYHFTLAHFDGIALGGLLRLMVCRYDEYKKLLNAYLKALPVLLLAAAGLAWYCGHTILAEQAVNPRRPGLISFEPAMYLVGYTLNSLCYGGVVVWCVLRDGWVFRFFNAAALQEIGKRSYAMYLLQYPAKMAYMKVVAFAPVAGHPFVLPAGVLLVCYLMAKVSWVAFEGPISRLKDRWTKHDGVVPVGGATERRSAA